MRGCAVKHSWVDYAKEYFHKLNQTYVDGRLDRVVSFFADDRTISQELDRWSREREQAFQRQIMPIASKLQVTPIHFVVNLENEIDVTFLIHQQMYYRQGDQTFLQENQRMQPVRMKQDKYGWSFVKPWGWYFDSENLREQAEDEEVRIGNELDDDAGEVQEESSQPVMARPENPNHSHLANQTDGKVVPVVTRPRYNRYKAVQYAEEHWNNYNPAYHKFENDCTSFVSQCLHAGGIPMIFTKNRGQGWWYKGSNWSYSWAVAHSLYLLLKSGKAPFYTTQVSNPQELELGDVICYDFNGDGRFQHNTFVVAKDYWGMPLVNAHTTDSYHRYWEYRDSSAYTPQIQYAFFRIYGDQPPDFFF